MLLPLRRANPEVVSDVGSALAAEQAQNYELMGDDALAHRPSSGPWGRVGSGSRLKRETWFRHRGGRRSELGVDLLRARIPGLSLMGQAVVASSAASHVSSLLCNATRAGSDAAIC